VPPPCVVGPATKEATSGGGQNGAKRPMGGKERVANSQTGREATRVQGKRLLGGEWGVNGS